MEFILPEYFVSQPTWFYLSLVLVVAVYFRFSRLWSVRNLDLVLLLAISPGLLMAKSEDMESLGYAWLFAGTGLCLLRLFADGYFKWRPRLQQNMNTAGLTFLGIVAFAFLMTKVIAEPPPESTVETVRRADNLLNLHDASPTLATGDTAEEAQPGPTTPLLTAPVVPPSKYVAEGSPHLSRTAAAFEPLAARIMAVLAHAAVIFGLIAIGKRHFGDLQIGLAMATLYLLLPCTAYAVGEFNHVLPSALLVWAVYAYHLPMVAGALVGLACGSMFFPLFLLPLWLAFYGKRGAFRFGLALCVVGALLLSSLMLTAVDTYSFKQKVLGSIDWNALQFQGSEESGFWISHDGAYRLPILVGFVVMVGIVSLWPRRKNLEHLLANSAAIVVATQLWYPRQGGVYLLWYMPLLLLVVFRPRLTHRVSPEPRSTTQEQRTAGSTLSRQTTRSVPAIGRMRRSRLTP